MPDITFHHGWNPTPDSVRRVRMDAALGGTPPASSYYYAIPGIGMLLNDKLGCCVLSGDGHIVEQQTFFGQGSEVTVTDGMTLIAYEVVGEYVPGDPSTDNGALISDGLNYLRKTGMAGVQIAAFGQVDVQAMAKVQTAVAQFGAVSIGFGFPASAMTQFNAGQPWDVVPGSSNAGGHCVIVCGYDADYLYVYTWGKVQKMTYRFFSAYVEEAWPVVSQAWVNAISGTDPAGVDLVTLGAQFTAVTGQPSPFPAPPAPDPVPVPVPADPDVALWQQVMPWALKDRRRPSDAEVRRDIMAWAKTHGYYGAP